MSALPAGFTSQMMQQLQAWAAAEALKSQTAPKVNVILQKNQIRGVNPNYRYKFEPYPKMMTPPMVEVRTENEERALRRTWRTPLPWQQNNHEHRPIIAQYYAERGYPVMMQPPQVKVFSKDEEDMLRAKWRALTGGEHEVDYPRWLFSPTQKPVMVNSAEQEKLLPGKWYPTPEEAMGAAGQPVEAKATASDRDLLIKRATELGIRVDHRWGTSRIESEIASAEQSAEEEAQTA